MLQKKILQERKMKNETEELLQLQQHPKNIAENKTKKKKRKNKQTFTNVVSKPYVPSELQIAEH